MSIPRAGLTTRAKVLLPAFLIVLLLASYYRMRHGSDAAPAEAVFEGETMGSTYRVVLAKPKLPPEEAARVHAALEAKLARIDQLMSTYRDDSELSRFNQSRSLEPFPVASDTARVVAAALEIARQSDGALDVTVGPLVAAWGFGAGAKATPPSETELASLRQRVGHDALSVQLEPPSLRKRFPELTVDLSAIAPGYAADLLSETLTQSGFPAHMVDVGGEIRTRGHKTDGSRWRIGIEQPDSEVRAPRLVVELSDVGLATSGDYRNYVERDGVRLSHTIDPNTGRPITHRLASVTVLAESAMFADGYATALNVLGPEAGLALAERLNLAAFFIIRGANGTFETRSTTGFDALPKEDRAP